MVEQLGNTSWPSIGPAPLVIVPLGSTEQHGPHLPFSTDSLIAHAVATALADRLVDDDPARQVLVAPVINYGSSGEHQSFAGTISLGHAALRATIIETVRSLSTWAGRILLINGHGGNLESLVACVPNLVRESHPVAWIPCSVPGSDAHAGRTETSIMLHLEPELVNLAEARPGNTTPVQELLPAMWEGGVQSVSATGVLGDPTGANAEEGARLFKLMVESAHRRAVAGIPDIGGCLNDPNGVPAPLDGPG